MNKDKGLLTDYQKGYITCLCRAIQKGCKKVGTDLEVVLRTESDRDEFIRGADEFFQMLKAGEERVRQAVEGIANEFGVKFYFREKTPARRKAEGNAPDMVLYKHEEDLKRYLALIENPKMSRKYHREMGKLFGYGREEIEEFIEIAKNIRPKMDESEGSKKPLKS